MSAYLDLLEGVLRTGLASLGAQTKRIQADYALALQQPDGGFPGRQGGSDLYYTDFALRLLSLIAPETPLLAQTARYVAAAPPPQTFTECFNLLNCQRLLLACGHAVERDNTDARALLDAPAPAIGAYASFLTALCHEILGDTMPGAEPIAEALARLQGPGGGFAERPGEAHEQTNATAAAVAFLLLQDRLTETQSAAAVTFLESMQATDGGFLAHPQAPCGDLLSTFTALATLAGLDGFSRLRLADTARFLRQTALPGGGFKAAPADTGADLEYTYYGLGSLALIHTALA